MGASSALPAPPEGSIDPLQPAGSPAAAWFRAARRYARLYGAVIALTWARFLAFRGNAALSLIHAVAYAGSALALYGVIFGHVTHLGDWTRDQVFVFIGTAYLVDFVWMLLWFFGLMSVPTLVRTGDLDLLLCRPANTLFLVSTRQMDLDQWAGLVVGLALVTASASPTTLGHVLLYGALLVNGVVMFYGLTVLVTSLAFLSPRLTLIGDVMEWFYAFAMQPDGIYPRGLRRVLTFAVPALVMMNFPARALTDRLGPGLAVWGFAVSLGILGLALKVWSVAERGYESAGG